MKNKRFTKEFRESILKRMQHPENKSVPEISLETGISKNTLYTWVNNARKSGILISNSAPANDDKWRKEDKLRIVFKTFSMNEEELGRYCRENGLYTEDIRR